MTDTFRKASAAQVEYLWDLMQARRICDGSTDPIDIILDDLDLLYEDCPADLEWLSVEDASDLIDQFADRDSAHWAAKAKA